MLTSKQRAALRSMSHALQPILHIGKSGVTDNIIVQAADALLPNELIKGTVQQNCPVSAAEAMRQIVERTEAQEVFVSGRKFVIYKKNPKDPKIVI